MVGKENKPEKPNTISLKELRPIAIVQPVEQKDGIDVEVGIMAECG